MSQPPPTTAIRQATPEAIFVRAANPLSDPLSKPQKNIEVYSPELIVQYEKQKIQIRNT